MRLHSRLPALGLALLLVSCQTLAGSKGSPEELTRVKRALSEDRSRFTRAVAEGTVEEIPGITRALKARFDEIWTQASSMNLLDRQHMAMQLASGRRLVTSLDQFAASTDAEAVRSQAEKLQGVLGDIEVILDRTIRAATPDAPGPSGS